MKPAPAKARQASPSPRRRRRSLVELRIRDLRNLAEARAAFAAESPMSILLVEALAHHLAALTGDPRKRVAQLLDHEVRWYGIERFDALLDEVKAGPQRWKSAALGWHLRLTDRERERMKITTIEAAGISPEQRKAINLEKRRQRYAKARDEEGRKPRAQWLADHAEKPWIKAEISRAKWYRLKRETGVG